MYKDKEEYNEKRRQKYKKDKEKEGKKVSERRAENWTFILYPESAPVDWIQRLENRYLCFAVSPLHDKDLNPYGERKKAHYHVIIHFDCARRESYVKEITSELNATIPIHVDSMRGCVRYLTHVDYPDKYQYNKDDIIARGGFEVEEYYNKSESDSFRLQDEIIDFCLKYRVCEYMDLYYYSLKNRPDWADTLKRSCYNVNQIITSIRHASRKPINPVTGEMMEDLKK